MEDFIVLGMVPGTHIQFNFAGWLYVCAAVIGLFLLFSLRSLIRKAMVAPFVHHVTTQTEAAIVISDITI